MDDWLLQRSERLCFSHCFRLGLCLDYDHPFVCKLFSSSSSSSRWPNSVPYLYFCLSFFLGTSGKLRQFSTKIRTVSGEPIKQNIAFSFCRDARRGSCTWYGWCMTERCKPGEKHSMRNVSANWIWQHRRKSHFSLNTAFSTILLVPQNFSPSAIRLQSKNWSQTRVEWNHFFETCLEKRGSPDPIPAERLFDQTYKLFLSKSAVSWAGEEK